ncbi:hydroperoxide isomerase ALOXE3-like [Eleutherodactylus coqui]|uniref:hydroperoxide isomerase ALOXE3-like n=1 Tax=Eleutherodactylus coqui TaxID=57060 RepID=UPI00346325FC
MGRLLGDLSLTCIKLTASLRDEISKRWNEDTLFGYQYLNGVNPMMMHKCLNLPQNFPVTSSMVATSLGSSKVLDEELQNGNVFLADYKILQGIPANDSVNGKQQYISAPMCLLWKDPQDQLLPIAIQLGQTPGEQTPIFLPSDSKWDWTLAKIWVHNAEFQVIQAPRASSALHSGHPHSRQKGSHWTWGRL